jgi:RsiW-degrading membrane proteinase PrsW (M82 family)
MKLATTPSLPSAVPRRMRLAWHLAIVLTVKVILLALLWYAFIKPNKVEVDIDVMGQHLAGGASSVFTQPTSPGDHK